MPDQPQDTSPATLLASKSGLRKGQTFKTKLTLSQPGFTVKNPPNALHSGTVPTTLREILLAFRTLLMYKIWLTDSLQVMAKEPTGPKRTQNQKGEGMNDSPKRSYVALTPRQLSSSTAP